MLRRGSRAEELDRLRASVCAATSAGRAACENNPSLGPEVLPLLTRLQEIREELEGLASEPVRPLIGDLYPFWIERALRRSG